MEELAGEVFCDGFYVCVDDGLFAGSGLEVLEVLWVIFERKCFPDRLGLGLVLPLYLDNDSFGNSPETSRFLYMLVWLCLAILMTDTRIL